MLGLKKKNAAFLSYAVIALMIFSAILLLTNNNVMASIFDQKTNDNQETTFASLNGFAPGANVSYRIVGQGNKAHTGTAKIDDHGNLSLPMPDGFQSTNSETQYNFAIDEENQILNVILTHNPATGNLSLEGNGTKEFTRIIVEADDRDSQALETRSDWAGIFKETKINAIWAGNTQSPYKIAFFNTNPAKAIAGLQSPATIKIQYAPGGGGPSDSGINDFETNDCGGDPQISYCDSGQTQDQFAAFIDLIVEPLQLMADELTYNAYQQVLIIGTFFDAKEQLEAGRDIQELVAQANRDYHPSEQLCRFGSFSRDLAHTEEKLRYTKTALNQILMTNYTNGYYGSSGIKGNITTTQSRLQQFREVYCDPANNDRGLDLLCEHDQDRDLSNSDYEAEAPDGIGAADRSRVNKDIDFARTIDSQYTLDIDFAPDSSLSNDEQVSADEEDIIALAKNLYWPKTFNYQKNKILLKNKFHHMDTRRYIAIANLANNTYTNHVAMKTKAVKPDASSTDVTPGWAYMKTMMREFGMQDGDIEALIGQHPSYYAQMDFLGKKLYQMPDFYTNLYDKEANVDRILASLEAISLMQQRDHYQTMLRHEMLASGMIQTELIPEIKSLQARTPNQ